MDLSRFPFRGETRSLDDAARASAPGQLLDLPGGKTHYLLEGPSDGQPVVLVHGLSVPSYTFTPTTAGLTENGLRVLSYDLFGRGYSDRPAGRYDLDFFNSQLTDLLDALGIRGPVNLAGLSMGGPIAAYFTVRNPARVRRLCLIDPAGLIPFGGSLSGKLLRTPLAGEVMLNFFARRILIDTVPNDLLHPERFPEFMAQYPPQMEFRGFRQAILATLRGGALAEQTALYRALGTLDIPLLALWGEADHTFPPALAAERLQAIVPQCRLEIIRGAGHIPHYEQPGLVNPLLAEFFKA